MAPHNMIVCMGVVHAIKWAVQRSRCMTLESVSGLSDNAIITLPAMAA